MKVGFENYLEQGSYEATGQVFGSYQEICQEIGGIVMPPVIAIDGPTTSGKSSLSQALLTHLIQHETSAASLPLDYFLSARTERSTVFKDVIGGLIDISEYSLAAWDHTRYQAYLSRLLEMTATITEPAQLTLTNTYDRTTGEADAPRTIQVQPGAVIVTEGVGLHAYHEPFFDIQIRTDLRGEDILQRVLDREHQKDSSHRLPDEYLGWRLEHIDFPHSRYLRDATAGQADIVIDTSVADAMLVYKQPEEGSHGLETA